MFASDLCIYFFLVINWKVVYINFIDCSRIFVEKDILISKIQILISGRIY